MGCTASLKKFVFPAASFLVSVSFFQNIFALEAKIGILLSFTGSQAYYGKETKNGIDLALEQHNKNNKDLKIKLFVEDSQSSPSEAAKGINKLITSDKVVVVIGDMVSSNTIAAGSIAEKSKIPILSPGSTNDTVTIGKNYIYRTCFTDSFQGLVMANFAYKNLNAKTAVILQDSDSDYSIGLSKNFSDKFTLDGGKVTKILRYSQKDTNFTSQLGEIRKIKPDVVFIPGFHQQVGVILREAKDLQINSKMLGGDGWDTQELRTIAKGAENGGFISNHYSAESKDPTLQNFVKAYKAKYNIEPSSFSALGYDSANLVIQAIKNANSNDPEKINNAIAKTKNLNAATGVITIDKNHNASKQLFLSLRQKVINI
ncbi:ABC transporter substrate-binding protein [Silvanigrella sp.]|jgi:branched-chain amino acid transport system substrate-binding protein|uniref:ABC transporter substrate-binding protein n=1 Tax=Silvanigrella sp. TaxID=2024976 RepID=UPI0037C70E1A